LSIGSPDVFAALGVDEEPDDDDVSGALFWTVQATTREPRATNDTKALFMTSR